jgi:restriction system protein
MTPMIQALRALGGSGTIGEIRDKVAELMNLSDEQLLVPHAPGRRRTKVEYRLAWTRTYLKQYGIIENSSRGVWALTSEGILVDDVDSNEVRRHYREQRKETEAPVDDAAEEEIERTWRDDLLDSLLEMSSDAFERLTQRLLRESGFTQVEVTGRSGDEGIDGKGILKLGGLLSFHVMFQCKRFRGSVTPRYVRDFRGAMVGRADKGLLITTGKFTQAAIREAKRDGAPAIDLIDGEMLMDKLKEFELGVSTSIQQVETVSIDPEWFLTR